MGNNRWRRYPSFEFDRVEGMGSDGCMIMLEVKGRVGRMGLS
jgi:hypothetical protein